MSMNVHVEAVKEKFRAEFHCLQTPTAISRQITDSPDRIEAYHEWAMSRNKTHAKEFKQWVDSALSEGLSVEVYVR